MDLTRKTFLVQLLGGSWGLSGCGGGGDAVGSMGAGCGATIAGNHGHVLTIAAADLNSLVDLTYDIHGTADHTHSVIFTAAMLAALKASNSVNVTSSSTLAHNHAIGERCT